MDEGRTEYRFGFGGEDVGIAGKLPLVGGVVEDEVFSGADGVVDYGAGEGEVLGVEGEGVGYGNSFGGGGCSDEPVFLLF